MSKTYLEPEEIKLLENVTTNMRDRLLIRLLFRLGCRVSEALALEVEDIDLVQRTVTIQHLKMRLRLTCPKCAVGLSRSHTYCPKCGARVAEAVTRELEHRRMRTLPVDIESLSMLREYIERGGPIVRNGKGLIFGINRHRAWQILRECAEKAGLPKLVNPETGKMHGISPHRLRDAFAVYAVKRNDSGNGLRLLQEHLGHQSFNTTAKYRKISGEEHKDWYQKLWESEENGDSNTKT